MSQTCWSDRDDRHDTIRIAFETFITYRAYATLDDMTHATPSDTSDSPTKARVAFWALLFFTFIVAVVTFVLSFHGLDDYGHRVADTGPLSPLVPVAVDGLTLVAVAATMLLRHAAWHVRAYAWFVFAVAVGLSIGGNLAHAASRHLTLAGKAGAAASPILLALASHLVIVTMRAIEKADKERVADAKLRHDGATSGDATGVTTTATRATRPASATATVGATDHATRDATGPATPAATAVTQRRATPRPPNAGRAGDTDASKARRLYTAGKSHAEIALALGISKKTAERHTAPLRQAAADDASADSELERVEAMA